MYRELADDCDCAVPNHGDLEKARSGALTQRSGSPCCGKLAERALASCAMRAAALC